TRGGSPPMLDVYRIDDKPVVEPIPFFSANRLAYHEPNSRSDRERSDSLPENAYLVANILGKSTLIGFVVLDVIGGHLQKRRWWWLTRWSLAAACSSMRDS